MSALGVTQPDGTAAAKDGKPGSDGQKPFGGKAVDESALAKGKESQPRRLAAKSPPVSTSSRKSPRPESAKLASRLGLSGNRSPGRGRLPRARSRGDKVADLAKNQSGQVKELEKLQANSLSMKRSRSRRWRWRWRGRYAGAPPREPAALADADGAVPAVDPAQVRYVMAKVEAEHRERLRQLQGQERVLELQQNAVDYDSLQQLSTGHNTESYDYVADNTFNVARWARRP